METQIKVASYVKVKLGFYTVEPLLMDSPN